MSDEQFERDQKSLANLRVGAWASQCWAITYLTQSEDRLACGYEGPA